MRHTKVVSILLLQQLSAAGLLLLISHSFSMATATATARLRGLQEEDNYNEEYVQQHLHILPQQIVNFGRDPSSSHLPLHRCQGHCSSHNDVGYTMHHLCVISITLVSETLFVCLFVSFFLSFLRPTVCQCGPGLMCYHRSMHETEVPGCVGGENDSTHASYCIDSNALKHDPDGDNNNSNGNDQISSSSNPDIGEDDTEPEPDMFTTPSPTSPPTRDIPRQIVNFGWEPSNRPLSKCQGHCISDNEVSFLIDFDFAVVGQKHTDSSNISDVFHFVFPMRVF